MKIKITLYLVLFASLTLFGQKKKSAKPYCDTVKITGQYKGVDLYFNPWDKSTVDDTLVLPATSISNMFINGMLFPTRRLGHGDWHLKLSELGYKKNDPITIWLVCNDIPKFKIDPIKGFVIKFPATK
jgi:hypothetical protein